MGGSLMIISFYLYTCMHIYISELFIGKLNRNNNYEGIGIMFTRSHYTN